MRLYAFFDLHFVLPAQSVQFRGQSVCAWFRPFGAVESQLTLVTHGGNYRSASSRIEISLPVPILIWQLRISLSPCL